MMNQQAKNILLKPHLPSDFFSQKKDEHGIVLCKIDNSESFLFHQKHTKGAHLRKLTSVKFHQIQWETPYYNKVLESYLSGIDLKGKRILDFGCGDGRFTQFLIDHGADNLYCVDFDYATLHSLAEYVKEKGLEEKVTIIHSDFDNQPFEGEQFDLVLSIGVIYYLNERYEEVVKTFQQLMLPKALFITSDPELEGFFLRTLLFDSLPDAIEVFEKRRFKETKDKTGFSFRVFDKEEWTSIFTKAGFEILDHKGISLFHNLLRVLQLRGIISEKEIEANESSIWKIFDYLHEHGELHKHLLWKLQKP
jgi:2-polyprenyl-3-methyl-5-hydroxy-6-metoxy-1,4-benzoquinol methylase